MIVFSSAVFSFEQTGVYAPDFQSIPRTFWWALVTMTTVGYGDVSPITPMGRFIAVFTMFTGIIIVALPICHQGAYTRAQQHERATQPEFTAPAAIPLKHF